MYVDISREQRLKHTGRHAGIVGHTRADYGNLAQVVPVVDLLIMHAVLQAVNDGQGLGQIVFGDGEHNILCSAVADGLQDHIHIHDLLCQG